MEGLKDNLDDIGRNLKKLRLKHGYKSYETFATRHGFSRMQYWRMENGKTNVTVKSLIAILAVYNIRLTDFFCDDFLKDN